MDKQEAAQKLTNIFSNMLEYRFHGCCSHFPEEIRDYASYINRFAKFDFYETSNGFYCGSRKNGKPQGFGFYYWNANDTVYAGDWHEGNRTGTGLYYSSGYFYIGEYLNDDYHGHGCSRGSNGIEIEADYANGERTNVWRTSDEHIDQHGRSYNRKNDFQGESKLGCGGIIVIGVIIIVLMQMCG